MHYEMRQIYDPMLNPHINCNHPANYYMVSSSGGIEPPRRLSYLEAAKGLKPVPSPTAPTPKPKIHYKAPTAKQLQYGSNKPHFKTSKFFTKSYKALKNTKNTLPVANTFTFNDAILNLKWTNTVLKSQALGKCSDAFKI
jgi:hypothetical protein